MPETELKAENVEVAQYEAPAIESVLTEEDMEREVAYAGAPAPSRPPRGV